MKASQISKLVTAALLMLYFYTAVSKILDYAQFQRQMLNQTLPAWAAHLVVWLLPPAELLTVLLLTTQSMRLAGMWFSTALMGAFTGYVALVLLDFFGRRPCSCGGVISNMSFEGHLVFNLFFLGLSVLGIILTRKRAAPEDTNKPQAGTGRTPARFAPGSAQNLKTE